MRQQKLRKAWGIALGAGLLLAASCSSDGTPNNGDSAGGDTDMGDSMNTNPGAPAPYDTLVFSAPEDVILNTSDAAPGYQGKAVMGADDTMYYVYLTDANSVQASVPGTCDIAVFGGDAAPGVQYHLEMSILPSGSTTWTNERVPLDNLNMMVPFVTARYGLDAMVRNNGNIEVVFAGSENAGLFTCGSGDLAVGTRTPGVSGTWNLQTLVVDSTVCCDEPTECGNGPCQSGSDVGAWASITEDGAGNRAVAYMDYHNNVDQVGITQRGLELLEQSGVSGIAPFEGKGAYSDIAYVSGSDYTGLVVAFSQPRQGSFAEGLIVSRRTGGSAGTSLDWEENNLLPNHLVKERLSMAVAPDGTLGLLVAIEEDNFGNRVADLRYYASTDQGTTWLPENIDTPGLILGDTPSLVYDSNSRPNVVYYVCGTNATCGANTDGVRYAWRADTGQWFTWDIRFNAQTRSIFPQLVLDSSNQPIVVFQDLATGGGGASRGAIMYSRGTFGP